MCRGKHEEKGRQDAECPTQIEGLAKSTAFAARGFRHQLGSDEIAAEHEEYVDTEPAIGLHSGQGQRGRFRRQMHEHDKQDGKRTQYIRPQCPCGGSGFERCRLIRWIERLGTGNSWRCSRLGFP